MAVIDCGGVGRLLKADQQQQLQIQEEEIERWMFRSIFAVNCNLNLWFRGSTLGTCCWILLRVWLSVCLSVVERVLLLGLNWEQHENCCQLNGIRSGSPQFVADLINKHVLREMEELGPIIRPENWWMCLMAPHWGMEGFRKPWHVCNRPEQSSANRGNEMLKVESLSS